MSKINGDKIIEWLDNYNIYIAPSKIHGIGIFAAQDIPAETVLFYYNNDSAIPINIKELKELEIPDSVIDILKRMYGSYSYYDNKNPNKTGDYIFLKENQDLTWVNFMNHKTNDNLKYENGFYIAKKDIKTHEELTINYLNWREKLNFKENE